MAQFKKGDIIIPKNKKSSSAGYYLHSIGELKVMNPDYGTFRNRRQITVQLISRDGYTTHKDSWRSFTYSYTLVMYEDSFELLKPKIEPLYDIF